MISERLRPFYSITLKINFLLIRGGDRLKVKTTPLLNFEKEANIKANLLKVQFSKLQRPKPLKKWWNKK